jgi:hypothetical protein
MQTFVVECYWPELIEQEARDTLERIACLSAEASPGRAVRSLGCILIPSDGLALFLFSASDVDAVRHMRLLSEVPFDRIVESVHIGFDQPPSPRQEEA